MKLNIRYRLIQILEIALWLGAAAGIGMVARRAWAVREQGWATMLDVAAPGLLAVAALVAALIVLIGIYHNTRRNADALERLARQGAGTVRRLPGAARGDAVPAAMAPLPAAPVAVAPAPAPVLATEPAPAAPVFAAPPPVAEPQPATPAPAPAPTPAPAPQKAAPSAVQRQTAPAAPAPVLRSNIRRLGPAS